MSFYDNPKVDDNSKLSEESVLYVKSVFTRRNKFISREENPDYGVDLDVELLGSKDDPTGNKFAIQIKSSANLKIISKQGEKFISLQFLLSSLGYLSRRKPGYGLIVFYSEPDNNLYFDFVEDIIARISEEKRDENWKNQESININLPINNILNKENRIKIYNKFTNRFRAHSLMLKTYGKSFNIPVFNNAEDQLSSEEIIQQLGPDLINKQRYDVIAFHLNQIPRTKLLSSLKLIIISALTYSEIGDVIEAKYYLSKIESKEDQLQGYDLELYTLLKPKIKFISGDIGFIELKQQLLEIKQSELNPLNRISIQIHLLQLEVADRIDRSIFLEEFEDELIDFFDIISKIDQDERIKINLDIQHAESINNYSTYLFSRTVVNSRLSVELDLSDRVKNIREIQERYLRLILKSNEYLKTAYEYAVSTEDKLLKAEVLLRRGKQYYITEFHLFLLQSSLQFTEDLMLSYHENFNYLIEAHNIFVELERYIEGALSLNIAIDLKQLFYFLYKEEIPGRTVIDLKERARKIEKDKGIKPYYSDFEESIEILNKSQNSSPEENLADMSDIEIERFAVAVLRMRDLPDDRLENIKLDMIITREFYRKYKKGNNVEILQDTSHLNSRETEYLYPPKYVLRDHEFQVQTEPSSSIDDLWKNLLELRKK